MKRFGPTRGELKLRLAIGVIGLAATGIAAVWHGFDGVGWVEVAVIGGLFFGGTAGLALRALIRGDHP